MYMNAYVKYFDKNSKYINFLVDDQEIIEKYIEIWEKVKNLLEENFDSEPVYNDKYIKTKINSYDANLYDVTLYEGEHYACFSVILLDFIVNVDKRYHPQIFLKEC